MKSMAKHSACYYEQALLIILQINTEFEGGAVARQLSTVASDLMFPGDGEAMNALRSRAAAAVEAHKDNKYDVFWRQVVVTKRDDVRH